MTTPYMADTPDIIKKSHTQVVRGSISGNEIEGSIDLNLVGVRFWFDENRAPRAGASIEVAAPLDLNVIDPRKGVRVTLEVGYVRPGGEEDAHQIVDLGLRNVTRQEASKTYLLDCAGDEALVIDASPVVAETVSDTSHSRAMRRLVNRSIHPYPRWILPSGEIGGAVSVDPITDRWSSVEDIADRVEADIYDNGLREWVIEPRPELAATPVYSLVVGEDGTILAADTTLSRDEWHNHVSLVYEWRDSADVDHVLHATAYVSGGPYDPATAGKRSFVERRYMQTTQAEANAAALTLLNRAMSRSVSYELEAIAAYWLRPGMTISVTLPQEEAALHLISAISFDPVAGTMSLTTRLPVSATLVNGTTLEPDPPPPPPEQTFTSTWTCNTSEGYEGDGDARTYDDDLVQGYYPSEGSGPGLAGNSSSIALFTSANSTGDESGVSISTALTGATIKKIELYLYADHWYYSGGGTARIGYYDGTTLPASFTGAKPYITVKDWARDSGRWVNVTSSGFKANLLDGSARGITVGPGSSNSYEYYGRFHSHTGTKKPRLRITYTKAAV